MKNTNEIIKFEQNFCQENCTTNLDDVNKEINNETGKIIEIYRTESTYRKVPKDWATIRINRKTYFMELNGLPTDFMQKMYKGAKIEITAYYSSMAYNLITHLINIKIYTNPLKKFKINRFYKL